jgi:hypothetical protein
VHLKLPWYIDESTFPEKTSAMGEAWYLNITGKADPSRKRFIIGEPITTTFVEKETTTVTNDPVV